MPAAKLTHWMVTLIAWLSEPTVRRMKGKKNPLVQAHRFQTPYIPIRNGHRADVAAVEQLAHVPERMVTVASCARDVPCLARSVALADPVASRPSRSRTPASDAGRTTGRSTSTNRWANTMRMPRMPSGDRARLSRSTTTGPEYQSTWATPLCLPRCAVRRQLGDQGPGGRDVGTDRQARDHVADQEHPRRRREDDEPAARTRRAACPTDRSSCGPACRQPAADQRADAGRDGVGADRPDQPDEVDELRWNMVVHSVRPAGPATIDPASM